MFIKFRNKTVTEVKQTAINGLQGGIKMRKRIIAYVLCVLMVISLTPTVSMADTATAYDVWVNGVQFTSENAESGISWDDGSATLELPRWEGEPYVLTLRNAKINEVAEVDVTDDKDNDLRAGIASCVDNLTIVLEGENEINVKCNKSETVQSFGIYAGNNLTFADTPGGSLKIRVLGSNRTCTGIYANGTLFNSAGIDAYTDDYGIRAGKLVNSGTLTAKASKNAILLEAAGDEGVNSGTITAQNDSADNVSAICFKGNYVNNGNGSITAIANWDTNMWLPKYGIFCETDNAVFKNSGRLKLKGGAVGISYPHGSVVFRDGSLVDLYGSLAGVCAAKGITVASGLAIESGSDDGDNPILTEGFVVGDHIAATDTYGSSSQRRTVIGRHLYDIWVNGKRVAFEEPVIKCGNGTATLAEPESADAPYVLTLDNATITGCSKHDIGINGDKNISGIYSKKDLTIVLKGQNFIKPADGTAPEKYNTGIHADKNLTINPDDENAKLSVTTVNAGEASESYTAGIDVGGDFVNNAVLMTEGGPAKESSVGLSAYGKVENNNYLRATGGTVSDYRGRTCGIILMDDEADTVNSANGELIASGGTVSGASGTSCGIYGVDNQATDITNKGKMTVSGGVISGANGITGGAYLPKGGLKNDGLLTASAGSADSSNLNIQGYGLYLGKSFICSENASADISAVNLGTGFGILAGEKIQIGSHGQLLAKGTLMAAETLSFGLQNNQVASGSADLNAVKDDFAPVEFKAMYFLMDSGDCARVLSIGDKDADTYKITVVSEGNGTAGANRIFAVKGSSITLNAVADIGYHFKEWQSEDITVTDNAFLMTDKDVTVKAVFAKNLYDPGNEEPVVPDQPDPVFPDEPIIDDPDNPDGVLPFTDVADSAWSRDDISFVWKKGMMEGVSNTKFAPKAELSRAMLVTILWRLDGEPYVDYAITFDDVATGLWYTEAIRWAKAEDIVNGYDSKLFGTNDSVTREQMAAILYRYAQKKGYDVSVDENTNYLSYNDFEKVSDYAKSAIMWAIEKGIIKGDGLNLMPESTASREQTAAILHRFCDKYSE